MNFNEINVCGWMVQHMTVVTQTHICSVHIELLMLVKIQETHV